MSRQDEPTDQLPPNKLTGSCVRCDAREIDQRWNKPACASPSHPHMWIGPPLASSRVRQEPDGVREAVVAAAAKIAAAMPPPRPTTRDELISHLAVGLACGIVGFLIGIAVNGGHI